jgi:beta-lactam-binding protein with PASTA domain
VATSLTPDDDIRYIRFVPGTEPSETCDYPTVAPTPTPIVVPDVVGLPLDEAAGLLDGLGLGTDISYRSDLAVKKDTVLEQYPAAGASVDPGALVSLVVSTKA